MCCFDVWTPHVQLANRLSLVPQDPATGGIDIHHPAAPYQTDDPFACPQAFKGQLTTRSITYHMECAPDVQLEVGAFEERPACQFHLFMRSRHACGTKV